MNGVGVGREIARLKTRWIFWNPDGKEKLELTAGEEASAGSLHVRVPALVPTSSPVHWGTTA